MDDVLGQIALLLGLLVALELRTALARRGVAPRRADDESNGHRARTSRHDDTPVA